MSQVPVRACRVSVVIKALNEEKRIAATIESALRAVASLGGEVILADSCSTDRTVELARAYPIKIVQLADPRQRCCGAGPQLGYQHSTGEFIYILDGDMQMLEGFLEQAVAFMLAHEDVAGVGGRIVEKNTESLEYMARGERMAAHASAGLVDRLDGGGLYRRSAIQAAGYFSDRNLHSYEEFDLAIRLRAMGWRLWRLPVEVANHFGHDAPPYELLMRRWHSRYICGLGELVRAAVHQKRFSMVVQGLHEFRLYTAVLAWEATLLAVLFWPLSMLVRLGLFGIFLAAPLVIMTWRKRSFAKALYAVVSWCFNAAGMVRGLLLTQCPPSEAIPSRVLQDAEFGEKSLFRNSSFLADNAPAPTVTSRLTNSSVFLAAGVDKPAP